MANVHVCSTWARGRYFVSPDFTDGSQIYTERLVPDSHITRTCGFNFSPYMGVNTLVPWALSMMVLHDPFPYFPFMG